MRCAANIPTPTHQHLIRSIRSQSGIRAECPATKRMIWAQKTEWQTQRRSCKQAWPQPTAQMHGTGVLGGELISKHPTGDRSKKRLYVTPGGGKYCRFRSDHQIMARMSASPIGGHRVAINGTETH